MKDYNGASEKDKPKRGGAYNQNNIGHEVCNFTNSDGTVFGYVEPTGKINIGRLGAKKNDEYIEGVTVVWLAGPDCGGTAVVGWYKNATVYRELQDNRSLSSIHKANNITKYRIKAKFTDAVLLPESCRSIMIPRAVKGGIGQSNIWYADSPDSAVYVEPVIQMINNGYVIPEFEEISSLEGTPRLRAHVIRERNSKLVAEKKAQALKRGTLKCEVCNFDFHDFYGELGEEFCEVHHLTPLHKSDGVQKTRLADLAIVCSNCHRMIHRTNPMYGIPKMKRLIKKVAATSKL
ncbi:HNH endonuclease [Vibrio olivae]|uniref:HNH endonuclease n=2 Tax=Vibrio olivae TaxID=1243002 RepID=A0ABV5HTZ1_9VIBR